MLLKMKKKENKKHMITLPLILLAIWMCATDLIPLWLCITNCVIWGLHFIGSTAMVIWAVKAGAQTKPSLTATDIKK